MDPAHDEPSPEQARASRYELISRIADDVAHELKNPLNSIVINLEVLRNRVRAGQNEAALDRADVIDAELRRLHALLEGMLRLLRPERSDGETASLGDVIEDVAALARAQARVARKELVIETVPEDMIVRVHRDALRFALLYVIQVALREADENSAGVRLAAARRADAIALRIEAQGVDADRLGAGLDGLAALLRQAGVLEAECGAADGGSACTLLLMQARDFA
ncbi:MAG TPA: histidine kinase dimerization/phospho-acceptor domain-containing protein [Longimicrobiales bacterium]|nr:histidine kinase dimerization/phospho-acceptor domain-containing protein [Longimicrobiales bacterium]